ncbi:MAG: DNA gyrase inhibitor YacG [Burkholderiales bacterium]
MASTSPRVILCPGCGGPSVYASTNEFRPFCSARCKNHDFGAWASGAYAVDAEATPNGPAAHANPDDNAPTTH